MHLIQANYLSKLPCSETKSHTLSLQKFKIPLSIWNPRGVTSIADKALTSVMPMQPAVLLDPKRMRRMWAPQWPLSLAPGLAALTFHSTKDPRISADLFLSYFSLSPWKKLQSPLSQNIFGIYHSSNQEEHVCKSKTLKPSRLSSETASGHSFNAQDNCCTLLNI